MVIEGVEPEVDGGRFLAKRVVGESVRISARIFTEGHDRLAAVLRHRRVGEKSWREQPMHPLPPGGNDRFGASFVPEQLGRYEYGIEAWVDRFGTWRAGLAKKLDAGVDVASELLEGAALVQAAATRARGEQGRWLETRAKRLANPADGEREALALSQELAQAMARHPDRSNAASLPRALGLRVERERARTGAWYEFFPRSCAPEPGRHGRFRDCEERLRHAAALGFDVVYLPPIHPIGRTHRKGPNNATESAAGDPGSPWAIGSQDGGHTAVHPELGTLADFDRLVGLATELGIEIALDLAFQCSPDHPWVHKHPQWFHHRPDGSIQYAENPPKKYQDIYPLDFECEDWRALWQELLDVVLFWIDHGVHVFRVDNPHTKPFAFWEWLIHEVQERHPETVFLAEAFTRPSVLQYLAKAGFSQSYSYFTWRNTREELRSFVEDLWRSPVREYLRANLFANTPDILHEYLQVGGRAAFQTRLVLAATLGASYGIYGPPFELCVGDALPGSEEYRDSEKYQVRHWDPKAPGHIGGTIALVNRIRRENAPLCDGLPPRFVPTDNEQLIAYLRTGRDGGDTLLVVVNLDPHHLHHGWLELPLHELGIDPGTPFQVHDLLGGGRFLWNSARNYVSVDPKAMPAHIFRLRRRVRTERDFDYYL